MLRAADLTPELVDAATEALLMSHRKFSETRLEAMRFTGHSGANNAQCHYWVYPKATAAHAASSLFHRVK